MANRLGAYFFLLVSTVCWGLALVLVKPSLEYLSPFRFLLYRYLLAGVLVLPVIWFYWKKLQHVWKTLGSILVLELLGTTLCLSLLYFGLENSSAIESSIIASTTPLFVVLASVWLLAEKQEKRESIGLLIAFVATLILATGPYLLGTQVSTGVSLMSSGNLLIIGANCCAALYYVLAKKYYQKLPKLFVTAISFLVGAGSFLLLVLYEQQFSYANLMVQIQLDALQPSVWLAVGYMAVFGSIIGGTAYLQGQSTIEASEASFFTYLQPLIAIPAGILLLQETIALWQVGALAVILIGVLIAEKRPTVLKKS